MIGPQNSCLWLSATTVTLVVFSVMACEDAQPPATCGAIPQVTVNAGETTIATACFSDPNGDMLSYSAKSTNPGVVTASISGTTITISGVAPGNASIAVTAADPGGLQGQQSLQVMVPNRAPLPRGAIPPMTVRTGEIEEVDASGYFVEPDGEALAYSAASSNPVAATASVAGSTVTITVTGEGTTTVTVTATDPGGLTATQGASVTVVGDRAGFRDDFNASAVLEVWELEAANAVVKNGVLELSSTGDADVGSAMRDVSPNLTSWTIKTRMGNTKRIDGGLVGVRWITGHARFPAVDFLIGETPSYEDSNYVVAVWDSSADIWFVPDSLFGFSAAINDGAGELTAIRLSFIDGRLRAIAENSELFSMEYEPNHVGYNVFGNVFQVGLVSRSEVGEGNTVLFDWIDVNGLPLGYHFLGPLPGSCLERWPPRLSEEWAGSLEWHPARFRPTAPMTPWVAVRAPIMLPSSSRLSIDFYNEVRPHSGAGRAHARRDLPQRHEGDVNSGSPPGLANLN